MSSRPPSLHRSLDGQSRPALIVSTGGIEDAHGLLWVVKIIGAENHAWPGNVPVSHLAQAGLSVASVVRTAQIATSKAGDATKLGKVPAGLLRQVTKRMGQELGFISTAG